MKRISWSFRTHLTGLLQAALLLSVFSFRSEADLAPPKVVSAHFDSLESLLAEIAADAKTRSSNLRTTSAYFQSLMDTYPEFHDLLRINSKGTVTNEVARDGKKGRKFRSVARQSWFTEVVQRSEPYYGKVRTRQGDYLLFWAVPMTVKTSSGSERSIGAVLAKIDLDQALRGAATRADAPLKIAFEGSGLFSANWDGATSGVTKTIDIQGMENLAVSFVQPVSENKPADAPVAEKPTDSEQPSKLAQALEQTTEPQAPARGRLILTLVVVGSVLVVLSLGWVVAIRFAHARKMKKIEEELESDSYTGPSGSTPTKLPGQGSDGMLADAATVVMKRSDLPITPPSNTTMQSGQPAAAPTPPPPPRAAPSGPFPQAPAPTPPPMQSPPSQQPVSAAGAVPAGDLARVRDQLRNEIIQEVRAQMDAQFQRFRTEVKNEAEAFTSQAMITLQELIGKLSQSDGDPMNVITTVSNSMKELSTTIDQYRSKSYK